MTQKPTYAELEKRVKELEIGAVERKRIEKKLEEKEQTLQALLNAPPESSMLIGLEGKVLAINEVAAQRFGKKIDELIGTVLYDHMPYDLAESRKAQGDKVVLSGKPVYLQDERAGRIYGTNIYPVLNAEEKVTALAIHARDITKEKVAEEALGESEERYRSFVQNFHGIAYRGSMTFVPIFFHGAVEEITGYTEREFLNRKPRWDQIIHEEDLPSLFTEDEKKLHIIPQYSYEREYRIVRKDGAVRWVHEIIQNICGDSGKPTILQGTIYDITERKQAEKALKQAHDELERRVEERTRELEIQKKSLEELNTAMKVLLKKREEDKTEVEQNVMTNVKELIEPYFGKINETKLDDHQKAFLNILESNLNEIVSPFTRRLSLKYLNLTPKEIQIVNMIKIGYPSKKIAKVMKISPRTVETHRKNIRGKIGLGKKRANLRSYLLAHEQ